MSDKEEVRRRLSIVDIIGEHVTLKRAGSTYKGLCPFHTEKTPSFNVNEERGLFKCFGCGEGGDVFAFVMKVTGRSFGEVLRDLADRAGVKLEKMSGGGAEDDLRRSVFELNSLILDTFEKNLAAKTGAEARKYLEERGIGKAEIARFRIGLSADSFSQFLDTVKRKFPPEILEKSGLFRKHERGTLYDLFRNRVMFPIFDTSGKTVAFGGRVFGAAAADKSVPKYINSPETPVYVKGRHIYALFQGKDAVKRAGCAVLVEGYTDVVIAHKHGFENVVAALGTALTTEQVSLLSRFTEKIVLAYDADAAGEKAMQRGIDIALDRGFNVMTAVFPEGLDPADVLEQRGAEEFGAALANARDFIEYRIARALERSRTPLERARAARELVSSLTELKDPLIRDALTRRVAERFGVGEETLRKTVARANSAERGAQAGVKARETIVRKVPARLDPELALLKLMLEEPKFLMKARGILEEEDFSKEPRREVFRALTDAADAGEPLTGDLGGRVEGLGLQLLAHIATAPLDGDDRARLFKDYLKRLKLARVESQISDCTIALRDPSVSADAEEKTMRRLSALFKLKEELLISGKR